MQEDYVEVKSITGKTDKLVIMLHGLGSDCQDLAALAPFMQSTFPDYHFVSLNGIEPFDMAPFGRQWFSLEDRSPEVVIAAMAKNAPLIEEKIKQIQEQLDVTNKDTILFGFSQGTMVSSYLTLSQKEPFAAMLGFSGRLLVPENEAQDISTKVCLVHGAEDGVVEVDESRKMADYFKSKNIENQLFIIDNLQHSIDQKGLEFAMNFLKKI